MKVKGKGKMKVYIFIRKKYESQHLYVKYTVQEVTPEDVLNNGKRFTARINGN